MGKSCKSLDTVLLIVRFSLELPELIRSFREEAKKSNILIAEVGVWNNMLDPDENAREAAMKKNIEALQLADEIGACCCVNISGARGEIWDGPYPGNYSKETFDLIVETVRYIIDQVKPNKHLSTLSNLCLICFPIHPTPILSLIKAIDRRQFGSSSRSGKYDFQSAEVFQ